ncbi:hypothetical protein PILCRDRAFT_384631 [Piloderma croceum F 1598]|uniref:Uncharacterized protein n=1 Tax=Piloderma croceum (strain F 1598) TaxID=765440 RepID=A0A0C3BDT6_PILCF|nr:hypothetical protein PILCRDRAFT_384631 [Piloderma croceum F 1598]
MTVIDGTKENGKWHTSLIFPNLYLGPCSAASNVTFWLRSRSTNVLGIIYNRLFLTDSQSSTTFKVVDAAISIIDGAFGASHNSTGRILVPCSAAVSRAFTHDCSSVLTGMAYHYTTPWNTSSQSGPLLHRIHLITSRQNDPLPIPDVLLSRLHEKYRPSMQFGEAN